MKFLAHILVGLISLQCAIAGTVVTSVSTLPSFGNVYPYNSSTPLKYTVSGAGLASPLVIYVSNGFEVSLNYGYGYSGTISIIPSAGVVSTTVVYVRFSPSVVGVTSGASVSNASVGSTTVSIAVSGNCIATTVPSGASTYYNTISSTARGAALKTALYGKVSVGTTAVGYTPGVWNAYATTDVQPNGKVWDIYSTRFDVNSPYEYTMGTNQCGTYSVEGNCYNREHSFPQSWFNSATPMVSELNHVFASDGKVNGMRNNYPYGNVTTATYTSLYGGKLGTGTGNFGYTGTVFEPIDEYKGDLARGYFFMATRYENLIAGWSTNGNAGDILAGNSYPVFLPWQLSLLLSWNNLDPVSDKEIKRNNAVAALQGNRNPFIDSPQYVQRIWGGSIAPEPTISSNGLTYGHNGVNTINLSWRSGNGNRRIVIARAGGAVNSFPVDTFAYVANSTFGSGSNLGNNCYVVYNGTGSSCNITGLVNTNSYYFAIVEYNGISNITNYNTSTFLASVQVSLPVKWLSFNANLYNEESVLLNWQTASEQNNAWFETERSIDMVNWLPIDKQKGAGTSNRINSYNTIDNITALSQAANIYYRIKQIDVNGHYTYSEVKQVTVNSNQNIAVQVNPNPFHSSLGINITLPTQQTVNIAIKNSLGITVATFAKEVNNNNQYIQLDDLQNLPGGIYWVEVEHSFGTHIVKCVKN